MTKLKALIPFLVLALCTCACATWNANLTGEAKYYTALKWYNDNLTQYVDFYDMASPAVQTQLRATVKPVFKSAGTALDAWKLAIGTNDAQSKQDAWLKLKSNLITALVTNGFVVVEGGE